MSIPTREGGNLLQSRKFLLMLGVLPLLFVSPDSSAGATEGTAYLSFQKAVASTDNGQVYTIRNGDTIARIIRKLGWSAKRYGVIKELNPHIPDLNKIYPGQKILLAPPGELKSLAGEDLEVSNYRAKKGDSLTRIISSELHPEPTELAKIIRSIRQLNPAIADFNKIYPGQVIRIPRLREAVSDGEKLAPPAPAAKSGAEEKPLSMGLPPVAERYLPAIRHIIELLNGTVITSGNYYIPLPDSGQVTIDCAAIPVVELGDGTTILLDFAGRLPRDLAGVIQSHWKNYHLVRRAGDQGLAAVLQEIILFSPSLRMAKAAQPLALEGIPQVKLSLDWLITKKVSSGDAPSQLGLIFAADQSQLLPSPLVKYALKKGVNICEILGDKVPAVRPAAADLPPAQQIKGITNDELLYNFLVYLGLEPLPDREVKIYDSQKDGFNLAIKAEYMMKRGGKTLLITKNKLPQQLSDKLLQEGMVPFAPTPGATRVSMLEGVLAVLGIPYQFALFSLPPPQEKSMVRVSFSALKIDGEKGLTYFVDYDLDREIYEFLTVQRKLNMIRY